MEINPAPSDHCPDRTVEVAVEAVVVAEVAAVVVVAVAVAAGELELEQVTVLVDIRRIVA